MHYSSIAYATTATCAAVVDDLSMSFSALCSAVLQVPASASHSASKLGWRPLPNQSRTGGCAAIVAGFSMSG